jgi:hypothetical protein
VDQILSRILKKAHWKFPPAVPTPTKTIFLRFSDMKHEKTQERRDAVTCSMHGEMRNRYKMLVDKPEGKRLFERPRRWWE